MELIDKIKEVEREADSIIEEANRQAKDIVQNTKVKASALIDKTAVDSHARANALLRDAELQIKDKSNGITVRVEKEKAAIREGALKNIQRAVSFIMECIDKKWQ